MKILIQYRAPLSDIVRIFPIAAHLAKQKNEVWIETHTAFRSILGLIDYAQWHDPEKGHDGFDVVFPLGIAPAHMNTYRTQEPAPRFFDFVCGLFPKDLKGTPREIRLSKMPPIEAVRQRYGLPEKFSIACPLPFSFAQQRGFKELLPIDFYVIENWLQNLNFGHTWFLLPPGFPMNRRHVAVQDLSEAATLIHHAEEFASINCAGAALASAFIGKEPVRQAWHHVSPQHPRERSQDDISAKGQVRWEVSFKGSMPLIVRQNARP